jgi:hypothetical protein
MMFGAATDEKLSDSLMKTISGEFAGIRTGE